MRKHEFNEKIKPKLADIVNELGVASIKEENNKIEYEKFDNCKGNNNIFNKSKKKLILYLKLSKKIQQN
jgi:hypothetical protein